MKWALSSEYAVLEAGDGAQAIEMEKKENPLVATLDLGLPPHPDEAIDGIATLEKMLEYDPFLKVVVLTGNSEKTHALQAMKIGAYDFLEKPVDLGILRVVLSRATYVAKLERENQELRNREQALCSHEVLGASESMQKVGAMIARVAGTEVPVIITGPSGTGKELVARTLHQKSARKDGPFVAINCGAIPETLLESELFGHEKGAFTGAHALRKGRIEAAQGGTLFLDEIGELPTSLQVKLLRFLQDFHIERVGGRTTIPVDVRIIAATNVDLVRALSEGKFREDLFYRISVVTISLPPLRERIGDIVLLAKVFLKKYATEQRKKVVRFTPEAIKALNRYDWPGNVRELENRIKRAVVMVDGERVTAENLDLEGDDRSSGVTTLREARESVEKQLVQEAITRSGGNVTKAATELGISRPTLHELLTKYAVEK